MPYLLGSDGKLYEFDYDAIDDRTVEKYDFKKDRKEVKE